MRLINNQAILIPVYQPTANFKKVVKELTDFFSQIIVVNDGSSENVEYFDEFIGYGNVTILHHTTNKGKGRALKTGIAYCLNNNIEVSGGIITVDADGQHQLVDIINVSNKLREYPDKLILGCRSFKREEIPFRSRFGNQCSRVVYKYLCGVDVSDTQTGLRGIPCLFLEECCAIEGERYEYETNMLLRAKEFCGFVEVPIETIYERNNDSSHFRPFRDSAKIYSMIVKYSLSSLLSVLIDYTVFTAMIGMGIEIIPSTYISRICSAIVNFVVNRNVVFRYKGNFIMQLLKYLTLVYISGTISGVTLSIINQFDKVDLFAAKVLVESVLFFLNYYVQRTIIFSKTKKNA